VKAPRRIAFVTVGDTARLTGGYLYHREVFARLRAAGVVVDEHVASGAALGEQLAAAEGFGRRFDPAPYDVVVVDALARAVCAPWLDAWRAQRPLVAMVHELPSIAAGDDGQRTADDGKAHDASLALADERAREAPLLRADRLIAVSEDGARILAARGVDPARIVVASGGLDRLSLASAVQTPAPNHATSQSPSQVVLCVAQWIPRKGLLELAQAWAQVARPGWRLELLGEENADPAYATEVRAVLAVAPAGSALVRGPVADDELRAAYGSAAIFALPARYEGYGIAFAEALFFGLPVVGCAVGPVPALVGPSAGLLVPPGDVQALAAALARLMAEQPLREAMAVAALSRAATLPTWSACTTHVLGAVEAASAERQAQTVDKED
jgi:glycosyltransferase involved in cell wall biosynthesis